MNVVVLDTETGGREAHHPLIQIAAIVMNSETGEYVDEFEVKLQFDIETAETEALEMNSYDEVEWLMDAIPERDALEAFADFMRKYDEVELISRTGNPYKVAQLAAYNAPFDMDKFLIPRFKFYKIFMPGTFKTLDVMQLALWYFHINANEERPDNDRLTTVYDFFGLGDHSKNAHDALADCKMAADLYFSLSQSMAWNR